MAFFARFKQWQQARKERRINKLTAKAVDLTDSEPYDLLFLHEKGFVRAQGTGQSITQIYANVESLVRARATPS